MANGNPNNAFSCGEGERSRVYSPDLQVLMQSLLAMLADLEFEHERECERLGSIRDDGLRIRALEKANQRHGARREPYLQQLAVLRGRISRITAC